MIINFRDLTAKGHEVHFRENLNVSELLKASREIVTHGLLEVDLYAKSVSGVTEVKGRLTLPLEMVCARCLDTTQQMLSFPFDEVFTQKSELIPKDEPNEIHLVSEDKLELTPYVEETVSLALPYIPLCNETCKGLCPVCGQNLNEHSCACKQEKQDPRLAGLADFFKE